MSTDNDTLEFESNEDGTDSTSNKAIVTVRAYSLINGRDLWVLYDMMQRYGTDTVYNIAAAFVKSTTHGELTESDAAEIRRLMDRAGELEQEYNGDPLEAALSLTYSMLYNKQMTREEAASFASKYLRRPTSTEAWRKRVDRWAQEQGKAKIEQPRGRPPKQKVDK